jgi:hypothetical protein
LQLDRPGAVDSSNVVQFIRVDRVNYDDSAPWPTAPDGHGSSLTRVIENQYGNDFINWMAASPTPGKASTQPLPDSDHDGIPDAYESAHGMNPNDPSDANQDFDGDGQTNLAEYLGGADPNNPADGLNIQVALETTGPVFRFEALAGRTYTVQYKEALSDADWTTLREVTETSATAESFSDPTFGASTQRFYRVLLH